MDAWPPRTWGQERREQTRRLWMQTLFEGTLFLSFAIHILHLLPAPCILAPFLGVVRCRAAGLDLGGTHCRLPPWLVCFQTFGEIG